MSNVTFITKIMMSIQLAMIFGTVEVFFNILLMGCMVQAQLMDPVELTRSTVIVEIEKKKAMLH